MTTIFGLKHPKVDATILVADRQSTYTNSAGRIIGKSLEGRKLWKSNDGNFCFGHTGLYDDRMEEFVKKMIGGDFDVQKIISEKMFKEFRELNLQRMGNKLPDMNQISGLVLATRYDNQPRLYTCFPLGEVGERYKEPYWTSVGSGETKVIEYMQALQTLSEARDYDPRTSMPKIQDAILIGLEAVRHAQSKDVYSHGLDLLVCTPKEIKDHSRDLNDGFGETLKRIQEQYRE